MNETTNPTLNKFGTGGCLPEDLDGLHVQTGSGRFHIRPQRAPARDPEANAKRHIPGVGAVLGRIHAFAAIHRRMKQWMENAIAFRKMSTDFMAKMRNEMQAPSRDDIGHVMLTVRHLEKRLLDRIEIAGEIAA